MAAKITLYFVKYRKQVARRQVCFQAHNTVDEIRLRGCGDRRGLIPFGLRNNSYTIVY